MSGAQRKQTTLFYVIEQSYELPKINISPKKPNNWNNAAEILTRWYNKLKKFSNEYSWISSTGYGLFS